LLTEKLLFEKNILFAFRSSGGWQDQSRQILFQANSQNIAIGIVEELN
jgi:hypothetical protein